MHGTTQNGKTADLNAARRRKALRMIYELKFTFGMDDLARDFLQRYAVAHAPARDVALRRG